MSETVVSSSLMNTVVDSKQTTTAVVDSKTVAVVDGRTPVVVLSGQLGPPGSSTLAGLSDVNFSIAPQTNWTLVYDSTISAWKAVSQTTTGTWTTPRNLSLTGDATATFSGVDGSSNVTTTLTLSNVNNNAGTFGSATVVPTITVNNKGLVTQVTTSPIPTASTSSLGLSSFDTTDFTVNGGSVSLKSIVITKNLTLSTDWQDTGIKSTDLETGTYMVQLYANDSGVGGTNINEYYSGIMSWYSGNTDSSLELPTDEIVLHRAGGGGQGALYLRTYRTPSADPDNLKLQMYSNTSNASSSNYVFKFKKML